VNPAKASFAALTIGAFASCIPLLSARQQQVPGPQFEISFAASAHREPITGRVLIRPPHEAPQLESDDDSRIDQGDGRRDEHRHKRKRSAVTKSQNLFFPSLAAS
jgi:hypothetical protein